MNGKPVILFSYDQFYPAYKAGGPIQSLTNLAMAIGDRFSIKVVCSAFDLKEPQPLTGVRINQWNDVQLPGTTVPIPVWYAGKGEPSLKTWRQLLRETRPSKV